MITKREVCVKLEEQAREWLPMSPLRAVTSSGESYSTFSCPVCRSMLYGISDYHVMHLSVHSVEELREAYLVAELGR